MSESTVLSSTGDSKRFILTIKYYSDYTDTNWAHVCDFGEVKTWKTTIRKETIFKKVSESECKQCLATCKKLAWEAATRHKYMHNYFNAWLVSGLNGTAAAKRARIEQKLRAMQ